MFGVVTHRDEPELNLAGTGKAERKARRGHDPVSRVVPEMSSQS